jgi:beta-lactamase regulating signal transducer with metallopeptidase domain
MTALVEAGLSNVLASAALAVVAIAVGLVCRRPAVAHALWLLVLLKLVTPPLFRVPLPWPAPTAGEAAVADATPVPLPEPAPVKEEAAAEVDWPEEGELVAGEEEQPEAAPAADAPAVVTPPPAATPTAAPAPGWQHLLGVVWLTGSAVWFSLALRRVWRFTRAVGQAKPAPPALQARVEELARQLGLSRAPEVRLVPGRVPPLIWAVGRPRLLLPEALPARVGEQGLDTLLAHELAHLRRRDHWLRWLEFVVLGLFWWDPLAWYARQQLREAEERCCDAWVVTALPESRRAYASAIVDALDFLSKAEPPPQLASGVGQVADLKRRLTMIMRGTPSPRLGLMSGLAIFALTGLLPMAPGWASRADDDPKKEDVSTIKERIADVIRARAVDPDAQKLEAELAKKLEEIAAIKKKIEEAKKPRIAAFGGGSAATTMTVRIEISDLSAADAKALAEALQKALPGGKGKKVILSIDGKAGPTPKTKVEARHEAPKSGAAGARIIYLDSKTGKVIKEEVVAPGKKAPTGAGPKKVPMGGEAPKALPGANPKKVPLGGEAPKALPGAGAPKGAADRLDRLEEMLKGVIKEMSELKKQMGRPGGERPGGGGGGGFGGLRPGQGEAK